MVATIHGIANVIRLVGGYRLCVAVDLRVCSSSRSVSCYALTLLIILFSCENRGRREKQERKQEKKKGEEKEKKKGTHMEEEGARNQTLVFSPTRSLTSIRPWKKKNKQVNTIGWFSGPNTPSRGRPCIGYSYTAGV